MHHRAAWTQCDTPERQVEPLRGECALYEVVLADRGAARRDKNVGAPYASPVDRRRNVLNAVARDAEIVDVGALGARKADEREAVGINDLTGFWRAARWYQFVAGSEHSNLRLTVHADAGMV